MTRWRPWREATQAALYGADGFFARGERPVAHFRTSVHASPLFAAALHRLVAETGVRTVVDVGAGGGELLAEMHRLDPDLRLVGVDVAPRPPGLPRSVEWAPSPPTGVDAVVIANEWLDNVPLDVASVDSDGSARLVLVDVETGDERPGPVVGGDDAAWLARWWPADGAVRTRAEIGRPRDDAWASVVGSLRSGVALAVDYAHTYAERGGGAYAAGTLTGYRRGRTVRPVPDGSCDITAHVAIDACAAAGEAAGATATLLTTQAAALRALGVDAARPPVEQAASNPQRYLERLATAGQAGELLSRTGLGGFHWLVQSVGTSLPQSLRELSEHPEE